MSLKDTCFLYDNGDKELVLLDDGHYQQHASNTFPFHLEIWLEDIISKYSQNRTWLNVIRVSISFNVSNSSMECSFMVALNSINNTVLLH